ncbi:Sucrose synthase [Turnera subulata]|uniref:sucrose synthase n=1 Tax=Turnera subulata TaxID=218843 RepID=A0A9Q0G7Y5_9ROSI|nr:Sucrose synthase [Turnera subulata]
MGICNIVAYVLDWHYGIEGKSKGILQHDQVIAEFEALPEENRMALSTGVFADVLKATQEAVILPPWVTLAVRPRPGVWEYIRVKSTPCR